MYRHPKEVRRKGLGRVSAVQSSPGPTGLATLTCALGRIMTMTKTDTDA